MPTSRLSLALMLGLQCLCSGACATRVEPEPTSPEPSPEAVRRARIAALDSGGPFDAHPRPGEQPPVDREIARMPDAAEARPQSAPHPRSPNGPLAVDGRQITARLRGVQIIRNRCDEVATFVVGAEDVAPRADSPRNSLAPGEAIRTILVDGDVIHLETWPRVFFKSVRLVDAGTTTIVGAGPCDDVGFVADQWA